MRLPQCPYIPPDDHRQTKDQRSYAQADFPGHASDAPPRQESPSRRSRTRPMTSHTQITEKFRLINPRPALLGDSGSARNAILTAAPSQAQVAPVPLSTPGMLLFGRRGSG